MYLHRLKFSLDLAEPGKVVPGNASRTNITQPSVLTCHIHGYPLSNFTWTKENDTDTEGQLKNRTTIKAVNESHYIMSLDFKEVTRKDNGTYLCKARDYTNTVEGRTHLLVIYEPQVRVDFVKAVGAHSIYLNWTVNNGNELIIAYIIQYMQNNTAQWEYAREPVGGGNFSYVLKDLAKSTAYQIGISARNVFGRSHLQTSGWITTLEKGQLFDGWLLMMMILMLILIHSRSSLCTKSLTERKHVDDHHHKVDRATS